MKLDPYKYCTHFFIRFVGMYLKQLKISDDKPKNSADIIKKTKKLFYIKKWPFIRFVGLYLKQLKAPIDKPKNSSDIIKKTKKLF